MCALFVAVRGRGAIIVEIILFLAILALDHALAGQTERFLDQLKQLNRPRYQSWLKLNAIFTGLNILLLILVGWQLFKGQYALCLRYFPDRPAGRHAQVASHPADRQKLITSIQEAPHDH